MRDEGDAGVFLKGIAVGEQLVIRQLSVTGAGARPPYRVETVADIQGRFICMASGAVFSSASGSRMDADPELGAEHIAIDYWKEPPHVPGSEPEGNLDAYGLLPVHEAERRNAEATSELRAWALRRQIVAAVADPAWIRLYGQDTRQKREWTVEQLEEAARVLGIPPVPKITC